MRQADAVHKSADRRALLAKIVTVQTQSHLFEQIQTGKDNEAKEYLLKELRPDLADCKGLLVSMLKHESDAVATAVKEA